ncbi:hypothetical protein Syun_031095 [Stephania yunnanensis]|uniref:Uncharacterized protein n=1 Tax=Stephania yunnanensis TaxID=152371 RepID=A0AAP0HE27_9MAGN
MCTSKYQKSMLNESLCPTKFVSKLKKGVMLFHSILATSLLLRSSKFPTCILSSMK